MYYAVGRSSGAAARGRHSTHTLPVLVHIMYQYEYKVPVPTGTRYEYQVPVPGTRYSRRRAGRTARGRLPGQIELCVRQFWRSSCQRSHRSLWTWRHGLASAAHQPAVSGVQTEATNKHQITWRATLTTDVLSGATASLISALNAWVARCLRRPRVHHQMLDVCFGGPSKRLSTEGKSPHPTALLSIHGHSWSSQNFGAQQTAVQREARPMS